MDLTSADPHHGVVGASRSPDSNHHLIILKETPSRRKDGVSKQPLNVPAVCFSLCFFTSQDPVSLLSFQSPYIPDSDPQKGLLQARFLSEDTEDGGSLPFRGLGKLCLTRGLRQAAGSPPQVMSVALELCSDGLSFRV